MAKSKSTKSAAKRRSGQPSGADVVRIGLQAATTKASLPHKEWAAMVKAAHGKGYTIADAINPDIPDALKARTKTSLRTQANQTVQEAYAPQIAELDRQSTQAAGLRAKRVSDESAFNTWFAQQQSESNARIQDAQQRYEAVAGQAADPNQQGSIAQTSLANTAQLNADVQKGASGDMSNSVYLKDAAAREQARRDAADRTKVAAVQTGGTTANIMNANTAAVSGRHTQALGGIEGDYADTSEAITKARAGVDSNRAQDLIKSYTDLLDQETSKASATQQYSGLMAQLSQKETAAQMQNAQFQQGLSLKDTVSKRQSSTSKANTKLNANTSVKVAHINADQKQLDRDLKKSEGVLDRNAKLRAAKLAHPGGVNAPSDSAVKYSQDQVGVIHTIADIIHKYGSHWTDKNGHPQSMRVALISRGFSGSQIDGGLSLARYGKIKNPSLYKQLGILPQHRG